MKIAIRVGAAALALVAFACGGQRAAKDTGGNGDKPPGTGGDTCGSNAAIMRGLAPTCAPCHTQGPNPFMSSLRAFETLLAYNEKYVVPGHPEQSYLVALLQGTAKGTYTQMPVSGDSFAKLEAAGQTSIGLAEIQAWITELTPGGRQTTADPDMVSVKRLSADQIQATLYAQLGLSDADFFSPNLSTNHGIPAIVSYGEDNYPIRSLEAVPGLHASTPQAATRFAALEGNDPSPTFAQALVNISQRWCKMAVAKADNDKLLFPEVDKQAKSDAAADAIKKNIAYLNLHFLGEPADPADVDDVFQNVFVPLEKESDPPTAWAGVCSYFIRHPKWVLY